MTDKLRDKLLKTKFVQQLMGFSVVGVVVTLFSMLLMYLFNEWVGINVFVTYVFVYILSILLSYVLNNYFVFKAKNSVKAIGLYYVIYILSLFLGLAILKLYSFFLPSWNETLISYMVIPFTTLFNFIFVSKILTKKS